MADELPRLEEAPPHNAAAHSAALARHIGKASAPAAGDPYLVFQQESPESWPPFVRWIRGPLRDKVNALVLRSNEAKADIDRIDARETSRHVAVDARLDALEAARRPFASGSG